MEVAIAFAGVALGWGLAFFSETFRERVAGQRASRLVVLELENALMKLELMIKNDLLTPGLRLNNESWSTHAASIVELADSATVFVVNDAYGSIELINELGSLHEKLRAAEAVVPGGLPNLAREQVMEAAAQAPACLGRAIWNLRLIAEAPRWQLLSQRLIRRRQKHGRIGAPVVHPVATSGPN